MKRKTKKYDEGGKVYDKEDEGLFGGKIKYREENGRKYVPGIPNPYDRNPEERPYISASDFKNKISNFFGGKKEEPASKPAAETAAPRDRITSTNVEERPRKIEDYIKKSEPKSEESSEPAKPAGKTYVNEGYKEEPAKKTAPKKAVSKASEKVGKGYEDVTRALRGSEKVGKGYEGLDVRDSREKSGSGKNTFLTKERQEKADKAYYAGWGNKSKTRSTADIRAGRSAEGMKKGGKVKSASARADGCAIRGKTRA